MTLNEAEASRTSDCPAITFHHSKNLRISAFDNESFKGFEDLTQAPRKKLFNKLLDRNCELIFITGASVEYTSLQR